MTQISINSSNEDTFKYSILLNLHYYDIKHNPERITKLDKYAHNYNFNNITPREFELNNPNISLTIIDENNNTIYESINDSNTKVKILKINNNRYAGIKPEITRKQKFNRFIRQYTHEEIKSYIMNKIIQ